MKNRSIISLLLTLTMLITLLAGCTSGNTTVTTTGNSTSSSTTVKSDSTTAAVTTVTTKYTGKATEVVYWAVIGAARAAQYKYAVDTFNASQSKIHVTMEEQVGDNTVNTQKIYAMIAAGSPPDMFHVEGMFIKDLYKEGILYPLSDFQGGDDLANQFADRAREEATMTDKKVYALPIRSNSIEYFYNKDHFVEAGLNPEAPPKTWDQFKDYAIKLTKKDAAGNVTRYGGWVGFFSSNLQQACHYWSSVFWSYGGEYTTDGKASLNSPAGVKACQYWNEMINTLGVSPTDSITQGFEKGLVSMYLGGEWNILDFKLNNPNLNYGIMTMPSAAVGSDPVIPLGGRYVVITKKAAHPQESWEFMKYIMGKDIQIYFTEQNVGLSGRKDIATADFFVKNPMFKLALDDLKYTKFKSAPEIVQMNSILGNALTDIMLNKKDIQKSLDTASVEYDKVLAKLK